jgi:hypothetical protein
LAMLSAEAKAQFLGHIIVATMGKTLTTLFGRIEGKVKLYIDGAIVDTGDVPFIISNSVALVRGTLTHDGSVHMVEVYPSGNIFWKRMNILIDGKQYATSTGFLA